MQLLLINIIAKNLIIASLSTLRTYEQLVIKNYKITIGLDSLF